MTAGSSRRVDWEIWGLVSAFALGQIAAWGLSATMPRAAIVVQTGTAWVVVGVLAAMAARRIGGLSRTLTAQRHEHRATVNEVEQLQIRNALLQVLARSVDVPLAFQALAQRLANLVPCDRVGLALLAETGEEFQTYTARVHEQERRTRPRAEIVFRIERPALGTVVRSREPLLVGNTMNSAQEYLDITVLYNAGFTSALIVPLVSKGRAVGTLNVVSRRPDAFDQGHIDILLPIAEILAVAYVAQQLQVAVARYRTVETMADATLSIATEINSALQTIVGHCDLLERENPETALQRDLVIVVQQAQRIAGLLEKMRMSAQERLKEVAERVGPNGIPSSPEAYPEQELR